jgi:L-asparaginase II/alkylhydroperoxidase/carboxymuconolactone decarboxylase family protein YurZ
MRTAQGPEGVRVWRGDEIESLHAVVAAVVAADGRTVSRHGDPTRRAWIRSSAKPIQLLPLVEEGLVERYGFNGAELAVMTASHSGEPVHVETVRRILAKAGLDERLLLCGPHAPVSEGAAEELRSRGEKPTSIHNNCSGKHAGMLVVCRAKGWPLETYVAPDHPLQRRIWKTLAELAGMDPAHVGRAIDGCGAVVFALPVEAMARAWAALAAGDARRETDRQRAIGRIFDAMVAHPDLVAGTGRIDTDLMRRAGERVIVKTGAEGVHCAALRSSGAGDARGLALKVVDGARRAQDVALLAILESLRVLDVAADPVLEARARPILTNRSGVIVGLIDARLPLEPAPGPGDVPIPPLSPEEATAIVRLGAAAASGDAERLVAALEKAIGIESDDIEELLLQTYLFAGFPRTINAFFTWQAWASRDGRARGERRVESRDAADLLSRGEALCRRVYGDHYEALRIRLHRLHPEIAAWTLLEGYGKVLGRPGSPGPGRRELAAVGALIALEAGRQLASHLRGALHVGVPLAILAPAVRRVSTEFGAVEAVDAMLAELEPQTPAGPA